MALAPTGLWALFQSPETRFYLAQPLPAVSCLSKGKLFALNGFRVILSKKISFPFTTFQKCRPIHMPLGFPSGASGKEPAC